MERSASRSSILVTGGAGFMGSAFVNLALHERRVINLDLLTYAGSLENVSLDENHRFVRGDIRDGALLEKLFEEEQFETIVHFAAETHVDRSIDNPGVFLEANVVGTFSLLEFVRKHPEVRFHLVSTDEVYGSTLEGEFVETSPYQPRSPYSASKAAADHFALAYAVTYDLQVTVSHASNNYGPRQYPEKLIPLMLEKMMKREPLGIYGTGENVRDWLYVEDHALAIWQILERGQMGEVYNVGGGNEWRNIDLVKLLIRTYESLSGERGLESLITFVKDRPGHDFRYALSSEKVRSEIGFVPTHSLEEGLKKTVEWTLENRLCHSR